MRWDRAKGTGGDAGYSCGDGYGIERLVEWENQDWWQSSTSNSIRIVSDAVTVRDEGKTPRNQANIRSPMDLTRSITLDGWVRYVDRVPTFNVGS